MKTVVRMMLVFLVAVMPASVHAGFEATKRHPREQIQPLIELAESADPVIESAALEIAQAAGVAGKVMYFSQTRAYPVSSDAPKVVLSASFALVSPDSDTRLPFSDFVRALPEGEATIRTEMWQEYRFPVTYPLPTKEAFADNVAKLVREGTSPDLFVYTKKGGEICRRNVAAHKEHCQPLAQVIQRKCW